MTQSTVNGVPTRTTSTNPVDWASKAGWYVDLNPGNQSPGERVNVDMQFQLGMLTVAGNVPDTNACNVGGYAWLYHFDYKTGQYVSSAANNQVGARLPGNALIAGIKQIKLSNGKTVTIVTDTAGNISGNPDPTGGGGGSNPNGKRTSWRELLN